jgi:nicotinamide-nucleotide amidase
MFQMYLETVEPRLIQELGAGTTRWYYHSLMLFGIGESDVEKQLPDLIARDREPLVGITVSKATITLRIAARCESQDQFDELIRPTVEEIREKLGLLIFGSGEMELQQAIVSLLDTSNLRLGVIEVGAGSWITQLLSQESAERETSLRAARWYATMERLESSLTQVSTSSESNCDAEDLAADGQASTMAKTLMRAAEQLMAAESLDVCLAVGCYPMHSQVFASKSLPTADFTMALARLGKSSTHTSVSLGGHPDVIYYRLAKTGLNFLRLELLRTAKSEPRE